MAIKGWQAALFGLAINGVTQALTGGRDRVLQVYREDKKPSWTPPTWLFPPAWTVNNATALWAMVRLSKRTPSAARDRALRRLWLSWIDYAAYQPVYMRARSPVLGLAVSASFTVKAWSAAAAARKVDPVAAGALLPTAIWTTYATALAAWIAVENRDRLLRTPPLRTLAESPRARRKVQTRVTRAVQALRAVRAVQAARAAL